MICSSVGTPLCSSRPLLWLAPLGLLLLQPALIERVLNGVLARFGRTPVRVTLTWRQVWLLAGGYAVFWLMQGLSFAALVHGLTGGDAPAAFYLVATWVGAYLIGFLSLLTPSGLGVREGALVLLLSPLLPGAVAAVVAIVARLWMVVVEFLAAGVALLLRTGIVGKGVLQLAQDEKTVGLMMVGDAMARPIAEAQERGRYESARRTSSCSWFSAKVSNSYV